MGRVRNRGWETVSRVLPGVMHVPNDRWVLWASVRDVGPPFASGEFSPARASQRSPSAGLPNSPLGTLLWLLLGIGLTQVPLPAALLVVGWLFFVAWRGTEAFQRLAKTPYD